MKRLMTLPLVLALCALNAFAWDFQEISLQLENCPENAACVAWGDIDSDGDQDLFVGGHNGSESALYQSHRGSFLNVTESASLTGVTDVKSAEFVDFDQDGSLDLLCLVETGIRVQLFRQIGGQRFQPVNLNLSGTGIPVRSTAWVDQDHDGQLDLILSNGETEESGMTVLRQETTEFNQVRSDELPTPDIEIGAMNWVDWDADGDLDLFLGAHRVDQGPRLYMNVDGNLLDWTNRVDLPKHMGSTGSCWFDFNGDHKLDLFSPGSPENTHLLCYYPDNGWHNYKSVTDELNVRNLAEQGVYACAVDANMDGTKELFVLRKMGYGCALLKNPGPDLPWSDVAEEMGIAQRADRNNGAAWGDCDGDADPDLAIAQEGLGVRLYRNNTTLDHEFVVLHLCGPNDCTPLPNCQVRFDFEHDKDIGSSASLASMNSGNGAAITLVSESVMKSSVINCEVTWPGGEVTTYSIDQIQMNKHNWLHKPTSSPEIQQVAFESTGGDPRSISNAPNPFNPSTRISFNLPAAGQVRLNVFDLTGRNVATLADEVFAAGEHTLNFEAGALPSGTYLVRLTGPSTNVVHRMMLLK
ncbi:VCBS repeat-containing protein [candidate division KSB1 bacterium]|nr:VCBS repeat-containing protein [candidate division KSB1 bacterium]